EQEQEPRREPEYVIELFVRGASSAAAAMISTVKAVLERRLRGRYRLDVVDVHQHPERAARNAVMVTPTLIKQRPAPSRRTVGIKGAEAVARGLDLPGGRHE